MALEVGRPDRVGCVEGSGRPPWMRDPPDPASLRDEPLAHEVLMKDLSSRERPLGVELGQVAEDLSRTPARPRAPQLERRLEHVGFRRMRTGVGSVRAIEQPLRSFRFVAFEPLVALLPTDAVASAQLGVGEQAALGFDDELLPLGHGIGLQPWHRQLQEVQNGAAGYRGDCHPSGVTKVLPIRGDCTIRGDCPRRHITLRFPPPHPARAPGCTVLWAPCRQPLNVSRNAPTVPGERSIGMVTPSAQ